ncbi:MAG: long-chain-fatty-acid--CoA ligase [Chloroflexota bacterium]
MATISADPSRPAELLASRPWLKHYEPGVPYTIDYPKIPLGKLLEQAAAQYPEQTATIFMGGKLSYPQLNELANRFANALLGLGVKKGDRVAIHLPNCPQFVIAYFGAMKIGAIVHPVNPLYVEREIEQQLNDSGAETIVTLTRFYPLIRGVQGRTRLRTVIATNIKEYLPPVLKFLFGLTREKKEGHAVPIERIPGHYTWSELISRHRGTSPEVEVNPDDIAVLLYTGGTTGVPKAATLLHSNLVSNAHQVVSWVPESGKGKERTLVVIPLFHSYGMTTGMNQSVAAGLSMILVPRFTVEDVLKAIDKNKPSYFPGVPTMYIALNNSPETKKYNVRSIKACLSGAATLPVEVAETFEALTGGRLVEGYGLSETSPVTHANPIFGQRKFGSIGVPIPDTEAKIMDVETGETEMPVGEVGELAIRGPQVMKGYWNKPEETALVLRNGWLYTGDLAKRDEDGYFYIVDRKKDMIIAGGYNIYPRDVEEVLYQHPKVKEAVVAGVPDKYRGETVKAYIVLKDGETATEQEMLDYCAANLAKYKAPKIVEFRPELPKTMVGKFLRRALVEEEKRKLEAQQ